MASIDQEKIENYGYGFIPPEYLPPGKDEYWLRNSQVPQDRIWRSLADEERETLVKNGNYCPDWNNFLVSDPFDPSLIINSRFYGLVRVGVLRNILLRHHDFCIPAGIRNSTIISCDIGGDSAVQDCAYISHYIIGNCCILSRVDEMQTTNHAKFGSGVIKEGEDEEVRVWIDVMNETGGRAVAAFPGMIPADAFLWAAYRDDTSLTGKLKEITQSEFGGMRGFYGVVGSHSTIKSCKIIKDVFIGEHAYIKGANKLKNITVLSSEDEPSQIGEGVEMVNGIMGRGCHAFYGIKAVRFVMGSLSTLKYGARLINSVLGDNSTVSCCEILNNLIFPFHEQHHNNSFLIASLIQGMSNMAAGATVGSNHNSRANDGEIRAGRGFWPGLSASLKHSSRFASFVLVAKGDYPYELNIAFPFSLVSNNVKKDRLEIFPAYFWIHNLYALERNSWKVRERDRRVLKEQHVETAYLAPDTVEEIIASLAQINILLKENKTKKSDNAIPFAGAERRRRYAALLKPLDARAAYLEMLQFYSLETLAVFLEADTALSYADFTALMQDGEEARISEWVNLGGQIIPAHRVDLLRKKIGSGEIDSWKDIHSYYRESAADYLLDRARHAWRVYRFYDGSVAGTNSAVHPLINVERFLSEMQTLLSIRRKVAEQVFASRAKDFDDPFRGINCRNKEEMEQVLGSAHGNSFIKLFKKKTELAEKNTFELIERLIHQP